ncbi:uncharacterized protein TNCV_1658991 [Trichonephila clavipes]|nr:uncharacterized protein TNCV_1658991 [Trichonephila clavipes]
MLYQGRYSNRRDPHHTAIACVNKRSRDSGSGNMRSLMYEMSIPSVEYLFVLTYVTAGRKHEMPGILENVRSSMQHRCQEGQMTSEKLTDWCALWAGGIIGPYFFKNDEGHNVTNNGQRYRAMITNFFIPELNDPDVQELWLQQDGATCHTARATIDLFKDTFGDRLISRFGPVNWPPRSCDLTPLEYILWGYAKSLVYADKPQTRDHLEDNIRRVIADIRPQMLEKVIENWTTSEPAVAVLCQKSYLKCNATRLSFE